MIVDSIHERMMKKRLSRYNNLSDTDIANLLIAMSNLYRSETIVESDRKRIDAQQNEYINMLRERGHNDVTILDLIVKTSKQNEN